MHKLSAFVFLAFCVLSALVRAETTVRVLEIHPAGDVITLGKNQPFYLRIGYSTDEPVRIWARPFFQGSEVSAGSNPSRVYTDSGEALGWFFFMEPRKEVDEIRVSAGDGSRSGTRAVTTYRVQITGSGQPVASIPQPAWLVELLSEDKRLQQEAYKQRMSTPPTAGEMLFFNGFILAVLSLGVAGIAVPLWAWWRWGGGWRVAASVPAVMMGFVVLRIVLATSADPTSHNLWPFEIVQVGILSLVVIGMLFVARKFSGAQA